MHDTLVEFWEDYLVRVERLLVEQMKRLNEGGYPTPKVMLKTAFYTGARAALLILEEAHSSMRQELLDEIERISDA